jgi:hypothetical protein
VLVWLFLTTTTVMVGMLNDKPIEEVMLDGQAAGWVAGLSLAWQAEGVTCTLGGLGLTLDEAIRLAESLE